MIALPRLCSQRSSSLLHAVALLGAVSGLLGCPGPRYAPLDAGVEDAGPGDLADAGAQLDAGEQLPDAGSCADDSGEDDDTVMQAKSSSPLYSVVPIALTGRVACPGDEDFVYAYGQSMMPAGALVTWDVAAGELLVDLLDGSGTPYLLNGAKDVKERSAGRVKLIRGDQAGFFIVRIRSSGAVRVPYDAEIYAPAP